MKIQNAFRLGLFGGLGVLVAIAIGGGLTALATILTYVGAALFLALGVDPLVTWLEKLGWKRWLAILVVLAVILAIVAALLVVGLGLVAAAFSGGRTARGGLIALGLVLSLGLITSSVEPWHNVSGSGVGDRSYIPATADSVRSVYQGGLGDMTLDLRRIDVSDLPAPIVTRVEHGVGDLTIYLPEDADARISVDAGVGSVDVLGQGSPSDGFFAGHGTGSWIDDDKPEIDLTINSGLGDVEVFRG